MAIRRIPNINADELDRLQHWFRKDCNLQVGDKLLLCESVTLFRTQRNYYVKGREHELAEIFGVNRVYKEFV